MTKEFRGSLLWKLVLPVPVLLVVALWVISHLVPTLTADNARQEAIRDATKIVSQFKTLRAYYTESVVDKVLRGSDLKVSIDHATEADTIPLPATFIHDMSSLMTDQDTSIALYSQFPFPNRAERQLDRFEIEAWAFLTTNPDGVFWRQGADEGGDFVRVAQADRMITDACVQCHNSHALSPKTDWKIGDVRGVLEVKMAIAAPLAAGQSLSRKIMAGALAIALLLISAIVIVAKRVVVPLTGITGAMRRLADGDNVVTVPGLRRSDEVGAMARAVRFFKDNAIKLEQVAKEKRELERKRSETVLAALTDSVSDAFIITDDRGVLISLNPAAKRIFGFRESEVSGKNIAALIPGLEVKNHDDGDTATRLEGRRKDGSTLILGTSISQMDLGDKRLFAIIARDITRQYQAEQELRANQQRLDSFDTILGAFAGIIDAASDQNSEKEVLTTALKEIANILGWNNGHVLVLSKDDPDVLVSSGIWHLSNPGLYTEFKKITEKTRFERGVGIPGRVLETGKSGLIESSRVDENHGDPNFPRAQIAAKLGFLSGFAFPVVCNGQVIAVIEFFITEKDGVDFHLLTLLTEIGKILGATIGSIRAEKDRQELERELLQAQKMESLGTLSGGIAHEINTPIQYIGDNIQFLQDSFSEIQATCDQFKKVITAAKKEGVIPEVIAEAEKVVKDADVGFLLEEMPSAVMQSREGVERISEIVQAIKEFSHPDAKEKSLIDLNHAISTTITVARNQWKYVADLETDFDQTMPPVSCLPGEFNQVILNLIVNAAHAIEEANDGQTKGRITIATRRNGEFAEIVVSDSGVGMTSEVLDKIFDPFFTTKEPGRGTGQGLSISHSIITKKHGGTISVSSEVGRGTAFTIRLPIESTQECEATAE